MCDTIVALGNSTQDGCVLFAKNSDRDPNEAHEITLIPAAQHAAGEKVKCTYIEIPQVAHTYQVLLSKPFWIWGAEMGSNEFGVTIGNEAVFTRLPYEKKPGLIGMDYLRLALERSRSADEALDVITQLLEQYGQGGNCGYDHEFFYHNSFLICDATSAWVLETAGDEWVAEKVQDIRSISNGLTIGTKFDRASKNLIPLAIQKGWCKSEADFDFKRCYTEPVFTFFADSKKRQSCTTDSLRALKGKITAADMMSVLRTHHEVKDGQFTPGKGLTGADVCMHACTGPIRSSQTAGSMVSELKSKGHNLHWLTGTAAPCTSTFKPVWMDAGIPASVKAPQKDYDPAVLFWRHEALHRQVIKDFPNRIGVITSERDALEREFILKAHTGAEFSAVKRLEISQDCFDREAACEVVWLEKVKALPIRSRNSFYYNNAWKKYNQAVGMPE
ncbi:MAG: C69 family dipeptidase [Anaerolineaceae bacterium]|nr:C69 family dipeptidase [Anaerolineaceae bacterium]